MLDGFHAVILRSGDFAEVVVPSTKLALLGVALAAAALWIHYRRR